MFQDGSFKKLSTNADLRSNIGPYFTTITDRTTSLPVNEPHFVLPYIDLWGLGKSYTPYEGLNLANQMDGKLGVFGRKLEGSHSPFY